MGRGNRKDLGSRSRWSWERESLEAGQLMRGPGRDGGVLLLASQDSLLRIDDGTEYELEGLPALEENTLLVGSGDAVFAFSNGRLFRFAPDESEYSEYGNVDALALFPTVDGMRFVYRGQDEIMYTDFSEDVLVPEGEYTLSPEADAVAALAAPGGGGVAISRGSDIRYWGPGGEERWEAPFQPSAMQIVGDPHQPFLAAGDETGREIWSPGWQEIHLPAPAQDWHIWQQGRDRLLVVLAEGKLLRFRNGKPETQIDAEQVESCRILPGEHLLLAGEDGLLFSDWSVSAQEKLYPGSCSKIDLAVHDESVVEVVLDEKTLWRGEI